MLFYEVEFMGRFDSARRASLSTDVLNINA